MFKLTCGYGIVTRRASKWLLSRLPVRLNGRSGVMVTKNSVWVIVVVGSEAAFFVAYVLHMVFRHFKVL